MKIYHLIYLMQCNQVKREFDTDEFRVFNLERCFDTFD